MSRVIPKYDVEHHDKSFRMKWLILVSYILSKLFRTSIVLIATLYIFPYIRRLT